MKLVLIRDIETFSSRLRVNNNLIIEEIASIFYIV